MPTAVQSSLSQRKPVQIPAQKSSSQDFNPRLQYEILRRGYQLNVADLREHAAHYTVHHRSSRHEPGVERIIRFFSHLIRRVAA